MGRRNYSRSYSFPKGRIETWSLDIGEVFLFSDGFNVLQSVHPLKFKT